MRLLAVHNGRTPRKQGAAPRRKQDIVDFDVLFLCSKVALGLGWFT